MHVAISGFFWDKPHVGSGQYLHQLLAALPACGLERLTLLLPARSAAPQLPPGIRALPLATPFDRRAAGSDAGAKRAANLAKLWFEQIALPLLAENLRADLLHVPYFAPPLRCRLPVVTTIHDLVPLLLPEYRGGRLVRGYMRLVSAAARRSTAIMADSEHSRRDIIAQLKIDPARVSTVYLAAAERYATRPPAALLAATLAQLGIAQPFVYYVGGFDARKNLGLLLQAWGRVAATHPAARLVLAGRVPPADGLLFPDIRRQIDALGLAESVVLPGFVSDEASQALYASCAAFVFPSRYEGFGLPPLEALASAAPVICADSSSLPEVVGDAAQLVAADDVGGWASAISRVLDNPGLREQARVAGPARAALFSSARMAAATLEVYQQALYGTCATSASSGRCIR